MSGTKKHKGGVLDVVHGLPEATAADRRALQEASATSLGATRVARLQVVLGRTVSREQLARRPNSVGEPFRL